MLSNLKRSARGLSIGLALSLATLLNAAHADPATGSESVIQTRTGGGESLRCLTEALYFEARGESRSGQRAVAEVILNRVDSRAFPGSVCHVVHQRGQFSYRKGLRMSNAAAAARARTIAECVGLARDLVNIPPNLLFPGSFADRAATLGREAGLEVEVLDEAALADGGFGGILAVGGGSSRGPRLVRMTHRGGEGRPTVALVGKGVTFDTGGISIKPAAGMEQMTMDMGGAAAVVATVILAARLGVDLNVVATVPMAENMPSATAYRPGDVLTMYGGTTVEVQNTDAEGRLILADAIVRACEDSPSHLIDTATLTGAQMVALGKKTPGVMGTDQFRDRVSELSRQVGEGGWPMPLPEELRDGLDSEVADLTNVTPHRWGGMLSAGLFLREFVAEGVQWAHVDIAGPAYNDGGAEGYIPKGATGVPVRTLLAVLEDIASAN